MKLVALLAWYDERPDWLAATVESLRLLEADHLVAVDGAYEHFPDARSTSPPDQAAAITAACARSGFRCEIHHPTAPWATEVEKRNYLFREGQRLGADWFFVVDADEVVQDATDVEAQLAQTELDVAAPLFHDLAAPRHIRHAAAPRRLRMFFRAIPGLRVQVNHHTYVTPDGRRLWGGHPCEPALALDSVIVTHRRRDPERRARALEYYRRRDELKLEAGDCTVCGARATHEIPGNWRPAREGLASDWIAACDEHLAAVRERSNAELRAHGLDPGLIRVSFRHVDEVLVS